MVFRYFSSFSLTVPKARTTIGVIVVLTSHNFYTCYLKSWYLVIFSSSFTFMFCSPRTAMAMILHSLFSLSVNTVSVLLVFYIFICLDCKVPKYVTYIVFQHWIWLMREPFVLKFNRFQSDSISCTGASVFFSKFVVSLPVLVSSYDRA